MQAINQKNNCKPKVDRYEKFNKANLMQSSILKSAQTAASVEQSCIAFTQQKQCRVCLHQLDAQGQKVICSPCKCAGTLKYLHRSCFTSWVNKMLETKGPLQRDKILSSGTSCEICKEKIPIKCQMQNKCTESQVIKQRIIKKPFLFALFTIIQAFCLIVWGVVIGLAIKQGINFDEKDPINSIILVSSLVILSCLFIINGYFYIKDFFLSQKYFIYDFGQSSNFNQNSNSNPYAQENSIDLVHSSIRNRQT